MSKIVVNKANYTFDPANKQITLSGIGNVALADLISISNDNTNDLLFGSDSNGNQYVGRGATMNNNVITLEFDTTVMNVNDDLAIRIESSLIISSIARGSMYWSGNASPMVVRGGGVIDKVIGGITESANLSSFIHQSPNRLTYIGTNPILVNLNLALTAWEVGGAYIAEIGLMKNGVPIDGCINGFTVYGADEPCSAHALADLVKDDYIEAYIKKFVGGGIDTNFSYLSIHIEESLDD